jgi:hypothetical protein
VPDAARTLPQFPAGGCSTPCGEPLVWTAGRLEGSAAAAGNTCAVVSTAVAGGRAWTDGRLPATGHVSALLRGPAAVLVAGAPASTWPQPRRPADTALVSDSADTPGFRRQLGAVGGHWRSRRATAEEACGHPQPAVARDFGRRDHGRICGHCGIRFPAGQLAAEPSTTSPCPAGTGHSGSTRPAPPRRWSATGRGCGTRLDGWVRISRAQRNLGCQGDVTGSPADSVLGGSHGVTVTLLAGWNYPRMSKRPREHPCTEAVRYPLTLSPVP